jgi:hypothetical protein
MVSQTFSQPILGLAADGPDPSLGAAADLFPPLIGDWQIQTPYMPLGEPRIEYEGSWSFRWGLGGRAVYDVIGFRAPGAKPSTAFRAGLTVGFYDEKLATWRHVWLGVPRGDIIEFVGRKEYLRILIDGAPSATLRYRWIFETITASAFAWEGRISRGGGATWRLEQTISGRR